MPTEKENKNSLEEPSVNNEDSPQNFSTIEKNESIWFMAEAGSSPEAIANHDDEELASNNAYTSDITHSEVHGDSNDHQESSYRENTERTYAQCTTMGNSIQTFSVDSRSFFTNSCAANFPSPTTPKPNVSVAVSECSTSETVNSATIFPTENYQWDQSEDQTSGDTYCGSIKKDGRYLSNEVEVENSESFVSPVSKAIATGCISSSQTQTDSPEIFKLVTASLIERNKTLVKEVRFVIKIV